MVRRSTIINRRPLRLYLGYCEIGVPPLAAWQYAGLSIALPHVLCRQCCEHHTKRPDGLCFRCRAEKRLRQKHQPQATRTAWIETAIRLRKKGMTCAEIGRIVNRTSYHVSITTRSSGPFNRKFSWTPQPWMLNAANDYRNGKMLNEIGQKNGRSRERVRQVLKRFGVPVIGKKQRCVMLGTTTAAQREKEYRKQIANYRKQQRFLLRVRAERLYLSGMSMAQVAVEMGLKYHTCVQRLLGPGIERRPVGHWAKEHQEELQRSRWKKSS